MTYERERPPEDLRISSGQVEVLSPDSQTGAVIGVDHYISSQKTGSLDACIVVGGIASQIGEHPLPTIAAIAADALGQSFVIAEPSYAADPDWQTVQGHRDALRQTINQLGRSHSVDRFSVIGYSLGGVKAVSALGLEDDGVVEPRIESILCLSAPQTENLLDLTYFRERTAVTEDALVIGRRQRRVPKNYLSGGRREEVALALANLRTQGVPITSVVIDKDQVVPDALVGEGIQTRVCILETDGWRPPDVHLWKGAENTSKLKGEIEEFFKNRNVSRAPDAEFKHDHLGRIGLMSQPEADSTVQPD